MATMILLESFDHGPCCSSSEYKSCQVLYMLLQSSEHGLQLLPLAAFEVIGRPGAVQPDLMTSRRFFCDSLVLS